MGSPPSLHQHLYHSQLALPTCDPKWRVSHLIHNTLSAPTCVAMWSKDTSSPRIQSQCHTPPHTLSPPESRSHCIPKLAADELVGDGQHVWRDGTWELSKGECPVVDQVRAERVCRLGSRTSCGG